MGQGVITLSWLTNLPLPSCSSLSTVQRHVVYIGIISPSLREQTLRITFSKHNENSELRSSSAATAEQTPQRSSPRRCHPPPTLVLFKYNNILCPPDVYLYREFVRVTAIIQCARTIRIFICIIKRTSATTDVQYTCVLTPARSANFKTHAAPACRLRRGTFTCYYTFQTVKKKKPHRYNVRTYYVRNVRTIIIHSSHVGT